MIGLTAFNEAWQFLKADESYTGQPKFGGKQKQPIDMQEYPPGSGRFMSLKDMMEARNVQSRQNLQKPAQVTQPPSQNMMVSPTGNLSDIPENQRWKPLNEKTSGWLSGSEQGA